MGNLPIGRHRCRWGGVSRGGHWRMGSACAPHGASERSGFDQFPRKYKLAGMMRYGLFAGGQVKPPVEGVVCPSPIRASLLWQPSKEGVEMINHMLCFANPLSGDSNCILFAFVQLRQLVLPGGATSSMQFHVFCESDFFSPSSGTGGFSCLFGEQEKLPAAWKMPKAVLRFPGFRPFAPDVPCAFLPA